MAARPTFRNPLHRMTLGDPFVMKFNGSYYAYGTPDWGAIPVLRSTDLVTWEHAGEALGAPPPGMQRWAPEVAYDNGRFFLYSSTGGPEGEGHQLRMSAATSPTGPFEEADEVLDPADPFTIDAHPFQDDDGQRYLFYSRDFLDGERVGTGIVVDRLLDWSHLAGERTTVLRPHAEWHIYARDRSWYDRVGDWFTVEGPFVRKHEGRYWCFYSGGAWQADNYGVAAAVAEHPLGPYRPVGPSEAATILRTAPGRAVGPGHACVVVAPDNVTEYLVYHAWDPSLTGRSMRADPLVWVDGRPTSPGPSTSPQPYPPSSGIRDRFEGGDRIGLDPERWRTTGRWRVRRGEAIHPDAAPASAHLIAPARSPHLLEVNLRATAEPSGGAAYGVLTGSLDDDSYESVLLHAGGQRVLRRCRRAGVVEDTVLARLPKEFRPGAYHQLLVRRSTETLDVTLDGVALGPVAGSMLAGSVGVWTDTPCAFTGVALTEIAGGT